MAVNENGLCRICKKMHPPWLKHDGLRHNLCQTCYHAAVTEWRPELCVFDDFVSALEVMGKLEEKEEKSYTTTIRVKKGAGKTGNTKFVANFGNGEIMEWEACGAND